MNIEDIIKYKFKNKELLDIAITHSSYAHENDIEYYNERIEYLGDAVLELVASEYIYINYPYLAEGEMTKARAYSVCEESLASFANNYGFSDFLRVGKCEAKNDGRYRSSILADAVEAIIGAIFLDGGLEPVKEFIIDHISKQVETCVKNGNKDYKTKLQEKLQVNGDGQRIKIPNALIAADSKNQIAIKTGQNMMPSDHIDYDDIEIMNLSILSE